MDLINSHLKNQNKIVRRYFLKQSGGAAGMAALASLLNQSNSLAYPTLKPHHLGKVKRVIWLTQAGAPSQLELFDHKPNLRRRFKDQLPDSIRGGQRLTGMTAGQKTLPIAPSVFNFSQHGASGMELSELLPHTAKVADKICLIRSMHTEAINHDPAMTLLQTGHQNSGRPSLGAWASYGLGTDNANLPAFVVMISRPSGPTNAQPLHERMWGSGFLPTRYQGVRFSSGQDPVLYLSNPSGINRSRRRAMLDDLETMNRLKFERHHDPQILARIEQYEMAFRMQTSVPELADISTEPNYVFERYGPESKKPGTFASNCVLARRLAERGVRFIQLYHRGWDQHNKCPEGLKTQCYDTDQPSAALLGELEERGLLDETLVVWGGEFGRTVYSQGKLTESDYGRDHHPRCYSMWIAGGGIRGGVTHGVTDDFSYNIAKDPVHIHDLNATILHLMGFNHERFTYRFQGRDYRLTDIGGKIINDILS